MLRNYLFNGYRRLSGEALYFLIPFGVGKPLSPPSTRRVNERSNNSSDPSWLIPPFFSVQPDHNLILFLNL